MHEPEFYTAEKAKRRRVSGSAPVIEIAAMAERITAFPGGSIVVITAPHGAKDIRNIIAASDARDYRTLGQLIVQLLRRRASLRGLKKPRPQGLDKIPALAELHYGRHLVASGLFSIPETGTMASIIPFVGGRLQHSNFKIESFLTKTGTPLEHVVLIRQPVLTEIEREITSRIPENLSAELIGTADFAAFPGVIAAVVENALDWVVHELGKVFAHKAMDDYRKAQEDLARDLEREGQRDQQANLANGQQDQQDEQDQQLVLDVPQDQQQEEQIPEQIQQDQGQQDQGQQDQGQGDQGQQDQQDNGGSLVNRLPDRDLRALSQLSPLMAASTLIAIRTELIRSGAIL